MKFLDTGADAVIASGAGASSVVAAEGDFMTVLVPTLDSCTLSVQGSMDGTDFFPLYDGSGGAPVAVALAGTTGGIVIALIPVVGVSFVRFVTSANQTAGRTFKTYFGSGS